MPELDRAYTEAGRVTSHALTAYLLKTGWRDEGSNDGLRILTKSVEGAEKPLFAILPTDPEAQDRRLRVAAALRALSEVEEQPLTAIVEMIRTQEPSLAALSASAQREMAAHRVAAGGGGGRDRSSFSAAARVAALYPGRSTDPLEFVDYRLAVTPEEKDEIYRLRYRAYLREGALLPSASQRLTDRYDDEPNSFTFGVYYRDELFSSIRISVLSGDWRGSPSSEMFADLLHPELDRGKTIIDPTRFVAEPDKARVFPELPYVTARLGYVACDHFDADIGLANTRPEHRAFYRKVFLQEPLGEPKLFPGLIKPVGLMAANFREVRDRVLQRFPFMRSSAFERRMLFTHGEHHRRERLTTSSSIRFEDERTK